MSISCDGECAYLCDSSLFVRHQNNAINFFCVAMRLRGDERVSPVIPATIANDHNRTQDKQLRTIFFSGLPSFV